MFTNEESLHQLKDEHKYLRNDFMYMVIYNVNNKYSQIQVFTL